MQKLPLQPPYYDMAPSESTPFPDKPVSSDTLVASEELHCEGVIRSLWQVVIAGERPNSLCQWTQSFLWIDFPDEVQRWGVS